MPKILLLKGLPASGKSTYAKGLADNGWIRVNKDELRSMLNNGKCNRVNEKLVLAIRNNTIIEAINSNRSVVVDDTNLAPVHRNVISDIAKKLGATFETKFFDAPVDECIKRDLAREKSVGRDVILKMYNRYLKPAPVVYEYDEDAKPAIIVDIDGTLAHMVNRGPFEWSKVGEDELDYAIRELVIGYASSGTRIILMSGRDSICREETINWLKEHNVYFDDLYMRPEGDTRKDATVKQELFDEHIRGRYRIRFVLDDRDQVVQMWRANGLKCLQVAEGDF